MQKDKFNYTTQKIYENGLLIMSVGHKLKDGKRISSILFPISESYTISSDPIYLVPEAFKISPKYPRYRLEALKNEFEKLSIKCYNIIKHIKNILAGINISKVALLSTYRGEISLYGKSEDIVIHDGELMSVGIKGERLINILSALRDNLIYQKCWSSIVKWASKFGISDLIAGWAADRPELTSSYKDDKLKVELPLANASYGAKQLLSIIVQLFSPNQSIVLIEEPEISLHPNSVALLPLIFLDSIKQGKQIIATTHSTILPMALSRMVRVAKKEGLCKAPDELITIYEIIKGKEGTIAKKLELDERGYIKGYIPSFFSIERELLREWEEGLPSES